MYKLNHRGKDYLTLTDLTLFSLSYMNDPVYKETVENSSSYNERLVKERKTRLPFLDAQTGVAQSMTLFVQLTFSLLTLYSFRRLLHMVKQAGPYARVLFSTALFISSPKVAEETATIPTESSKQLQ